MIHGGELYGLTNKYDLAIDRIRAFEPEEGYYLAYLAKEAGVKFDAHFHLMTIDPPEVVKFVKKNYPDVIIEKPKNTMWELIILKKTPPTRTIRYCCDLKKVGGKDRVVMTGVRRAESQKRRNRPIVQINVGTKKEIRLNNDKDIKDYEIHQSKGKTILTPIVDWSQAEVWEYLNGNGIPHCSLYDEGFTRLGCIGCPLSGRKNMLKDFARWPKYYDAYMRTFDRMLKAREQAGMVNSKWPDAQAVMDWWTNTPFFDELDDISTLDDWTEGEERER